MSIVSVCVYVIVCMCVRACVYLRVSVRICVRVCNANIGVCVRSTYVHSYVLREHACICTFANKATLTSIRVLIASVVWAVRQLEGGDYFYYR
jgi:hypothetical protein